MRADNSPTKTGPPGNSGEANAKPINERLGDASAERMLPRQEEPLELRNPASGVTIRSDEGAAAPAASPPTRAVTQRAAQPVRPAAASTAAASGGSAPLAITPPVRTATASDTGGFVVQLVAQKSEAEAQATFRSMQAKYSVLSGRHVLIRRKDQGERGVFYAAQIGPFGTRDEAGHLCDTLKSSGGNCFVLKN
jgi:cell division septation protein DedD